MHCLNKDEMVKPSLHSIKNFFTKKYLCHLKQNYLESSINKIFLDYLELCPQYGNYSPDI